MTAFRGFEGELNAANCVVDAMSLLGELDGAPLASHVVQPGMGKVSPQETALLDARDSHVHGFTAVLRTPGARVPGSNANRRRPPQREGGEAERRTKSGRVNSIGPMRSSPLMLPLCFADFIDISRLILVAAPIVVDVWCFRSQPVL